MQLEQIFSENQRFLWGLSYRMTGSVADADDICQETFIRLMQKPPTNTEEPLRPWLVRVTVNLSRDVLRQRRRQNYIGQWLPAPFETENNDEVLTIADSINTDTPATYYELRESISFAFLLAIELLTPTQRAVLLLRDVFDFNVSETSQTLQMTEQNVKTTHHRARRVMRDYEENRCVPQESLVKKTSHIVNQLANFLTNRDTESAAQLLAANVVSISDGGGEFSAAKIPVVGREKVIVFLANLFKMTENTETKIVELNGLFAVISDRENVPTGYAPHVTTLFQLDKNGLIDRIYFVLASRKLTGLKTKTNLCR